MSTYQLEIKPKPLLPLLAKQTIVTALTHITCTDADTSIGIGNKFSSISASIGIGTVQSISIGTAKPNIPKYLYLVSKKLS